MKRSSNFFLIILLILLLFSSCSKESSNTETDSGFLTEPGAFRYQDFSKNFIETEYGEYALSYNKNLYFSETGKHDFHVLCNKPDCEHNDENCNAYAGIAVGYYNKYIYYVDFNESKGRFILSRMNLDGAGHEAVMNLPIIEDKLTGTAGAAASTDSFAFNNGFLYMVLTDNMTSKVDTSDILYKINLETQKSIQLFVDCFRNYRYLGFKFFGDTLYLSICDKDPENDYTTAVIRTCHLAKADVSTGEISIIIDDWPYIGGIPPVERDGVLYYHRPGIGYCEYDLSFEKETVKLKADLYLSQTSYTDKYIFARELPNIPGENRRKTGTADDWVFKVYNYDYECLNTIEKGSFVKVPMLLFTAKDVLYFSSMTDHTITHYAEIDKVGTDDFQLIPAPNAVDSRRIVKSD